MMIVEECLKEKEIEEKENVDTKRLELGETSCGSSGIYINWFNLFLPCQTNEKIVEIVLMTCLYFEKS